MNPFNNIDKTKLSTLLMNSGAVGLAGALAYLIPRITDDVVGPVLAAPIVVALGLALAALRKYALPADADVVTPSVGSLEARGEVHVEKLEARACEDAKFLKSYLEGK